MRSQFLMLNIGLFVQGLVLFIFLSMDLLTQVCLNKMISIQFLSLGESSNLLAMCQLTT